MDWSVFIASAIIVITISIIIGFLWSTYADKLESWHNKTQKEDKTKN